MSAQNYPHNPATNTPTRLNLGRVLTYGLISIVAAVLANLAAFFILAALLDLPAEFPPLNAGAITFFTTVGVSMGVLVLAALTRFARNPLRTYTIVAAVALVISILPNIGLMLNPEAAPFPGGSAQNFAILILFHIIAAVVHIAVVHRLRLGDSR